MGPSPLSSGTPPDRGASATVPIRSRKVRKVLKLEARAAPLLTRAEALRREARAAEVTLTGTELGELRRARNATAQ